MKNLTTIALLSFTVFSSCKKTEVLPGKNIHPSLISENFDTYTIRQKHQYCDQNSFVPVEYQELKFVVKFDSSAIYTTTDPNNQYDINKLYGFSDNDSAHHLYSARFGWRWSDNALRLFAYVYNSGLRTSKELGEIEIGKKINCAIKVDSSRYIFMLNDVADTLIRTSTTKKGKGYKLYPYFGGDETAPHAINILIKEIK